jgi:predicted RNase H-like HicB family nuclease
MILNRKFLVLINLSSTFAINIKINMEEYKTTLTCDFTIIVKPSVDYGFVGFCKEVPEAFSQASTKGQTVLNVKNAICAIFDSNKLDEHFMLKTY